jgi:HK97 family phage portal protein
MQLARILQPSSPRTSFSQDAGSYSFKNPPNSYLKKFTSGQHAGVPVSTKSALRLGMFFFCVRLVASAIACMPGSTFQKVENGGRKPVENLPSSKIISTEANNYLSSFHWRFLAIAQAIIQGNSYAEIIRDRFLRPIGIKPILNRVTTELVKGENGVDHKIHYIHEDGKWNSSEQRWQNSHVKRWLPDEDVIHIHLFTLDGISGLSLIEMQSMGLSLALVKQKFEADFYKSGIHSGGIITLPEGMELDDEDEQDGSIATERVAESLKQTYLGVDNFHKVMILEDGMTFHPLAIKLSDAQHLEGTVKSDKDICRMVGVPPFKAGIHDGNGTGYKTPEAADKAFSTEGVLPWVLATENELNRKLLREDQKGTYYHKLNMAALFRANIKDRYEAYANALGSKAPGWMTKEEVRAFEEMSAEPSGALWSPTNMQPDNERGKDNA